ncbi:MAG: glycosyltransferase, partial [Acidimicrobiales bacterium]
MNVYVRELVASLAQAGSECQVYVRRWRADLPDEVAVEPGFRVVHIDAGPPELPKEQLPDIVDDFTNGVLAHLADHPVDAVHANYWLSGVAGHRIKHELGLPLVVTFHTLARVKAETGDPEPQRRIDAETAVIGCSDAICASCDAEADQLRRLYGAARERIEVISPGVLHAFFSPGDKAGARVAVGLGAQPVLLFVGRVQPLKGLDIAIRTLATIARTDAILVAVGGPSGRAGNVEFARCRDLVEQLGVGDRV